MDIEVDKAGIEEGGDVVQRGVEGERCLDRARDRSVGSIEGPGNGRSILSDGSSMKMGLGHLLDVIGKKVARGKALVHESNGGKTIDQLLWW